MNQSNVPAYLAVSLQGNNLLEASAGTGKTFTVALLYLRAILGLGTTNNKPLAVKSILVVTFTNAATEELIGRIRERIKEALLYVDHPGKDSALIDVLNAAYQLNDRDKQQCKILLKTALSEISFAHISTIHSFCAEICKTIAVDSGLPLSISLSTDSTLIEQTIKDVWRENISSGGGYYQSLVSKYSSHESIYRKALTNNMHQLAVPKDAILQEEFFNLRPERQRLEAFFEKYKPLFKAPYNESKVREALRSLYSVTEDNFQITAKTVKFFSANNIISDGSIKAKADENLKATLLTEVVSISFFALCAPFSSTRKRNLPFVNFNFFYKSYQSLVKRLNVQEGVTGHIYSDRLIQLAAGVSDDKRVAELMRKKLPLAIIDEFQDTDPFQYRLFKNIYNAPDCGLLMVGDPKQAIYAFRGGDVHTYLKAKQDVQHCYDLSNNYRSADKLVAGINTIFEQPLIKEHKHNEEGVFSQKDIDFLPVTAKANKSLLMVERNGEVSPLCAIYGEYLPDNADCSLNAGARQSVIAKSCSEYVSKLLSLSKQGKCYFVDSEKTDVKKETLKHSDIALLVNSHTEAKLLKSALLENGIASLTQSRESIYQEQEAYDCWLILRAILEPVNQRYFESALLAEVNGLGYKKVYDIINNEAVLQEWVGNVHELNESLLTKGPLVAMTRWFNMVGATQWLMKIENDRQATNVTQLLELLQDDYTLFGGGLKLLMRFERMISSSDNADESLIRLESDEDRVKIITIHSSKGLEYPVVFVPFAWRDSVQMRDKLYSSHDETGDIVLGFSDEIKKAQIKELKNEKLRLFYVALTRASRHLVLYFIDAHDSKSKSLDPSKAYNQSPLGWYFPTSNDSESVQLAHTSFNKALTKVNEGCTTLDSCDLSSVDEELFSPTTQDLEKTGKTFAGVVDQRIGTTSFSMLTRGYSVALKDDDENEEQAEQDNVIPKGRYSLAKGAHIGTALHNVLEFTDFTTMAKQSDEENKTQLRSLLKRELMANGVVVNNEKLEQVIPEYTQWMEEVINTPFLNIESDTPLALKNLTSYYPELTFTFSLDRHFSKSGLRTLLIQLGYNLEGLSGSSIYGMLTGAIDLIFLHDGKYYLADYKSNHLGNDYSSYTVDKLAVNNDKKAYTLQYLIYTVALHKHLSERIHDYSYEAHFGGVLYLYLRGMHPKQGDKGVFFDLPDYSIVESLSNYFSSADKLMEEAS